MLTKVIILTPCASSMVTADVEGSIALAVTGTEGTAVHSHSLLTGLLWILWRRVWRVDWSEGQAVGCSWLMGQLRRTAGSQRGREQRD